VGYVLLVVLVVGAVLFVALPLARAGSHEEWKVESAEQQRLVELRERRDQALLSLRELELDHETGKLDDRDYEQARRELRDEAVAALAALDDDIRALDPQHAPPPIAEAEPEPAADRRTDR
jgi:transposase